jgi:3',5'-cyclic AMP phosphodiesterase CpdA
MPRREEKACEKRSRPEKPLIRIAHVSDLHVLSRTHAHWRRIVFNKRMTGYANLLLQRGRVHRRDYLQAVLAAATAHADHLVVTGDVTNLSLEHEYEEACALLDEAARRTEVTVVPGNHDIYLPVTLHERRFPHHFAKYLASDLPELARDLAAGRYPSVKLRGPLAIISLSSAVPRPPFVAAGYAGHAQLEALEAVLAHPEVRGRMPVLLIHHPPVDPRPRILRLRDGLVDAEAFRRSLAGLARGLVLFGHTHVRVRCALPTAKGRVDVISASGGALDHPDGAVRAGFNLYEFDEDGNLASAEAQVIDPRGGGFERMPIAEAAGCAGRRSP